VLLFTAFQEPQVFGRGTVIDEHGADWNDSASFDGKAIFMVNCASCHNPVKDAVGPALAQINSIRSREWLGKFLTEPKYKPRDKWAADLRKQYLMSCEKLPEPSCEEVAAALNFTIH